MDTCVGSSLRLVPRSSQSQAKTRHYVSYGAGPHGRPRLKKGPSAEGEELERYVCVLKRTNILLWSGMCAPLGFPRKFHDFSSKTERSDSLMVVLRRASHQQAIG